MSWNFEEGEPLTPEEVKVLFPGVLVDDRATHYIKTDGKLIRYTAPNMNLRSYLQIWDGEFWVLNFVMLKNRTV